MRTYSYQQVFTKRGCQLNNLKQWNYIRYRQEIPDIGKESSRNLENIVKRPFQVSHSPLRKTGVAPFFPLLKIIAHFFEEALFRLARFGIEVGHFA